MADEDRDPTVSQRYRELGREEPRPELDAAILAASRRAAEMHPAPLVAPTGRRRWYFPVAAAAIIVLAAAVTFHMERQQPEPDMPVAAAPAPEPAKTPVIKPSAVERNASRAEAPKREPRAAAAADAVREAAPAAQSAAGALSVRSEARAARLPAQAESPERTLERIAELRRQGRHDEADQALKEFRKRYPDYRIPQAVLEKVEKK